jgi:hypothetical protein
MSRQDRAAREAAALRANLLKRKAQAKAREAANEEAPHDAEGRVPEGDTSQRRPPEA